MVLKPYVHNVYMNQEGYSDIDYTKKEYEEALMRLQSDFQSDEFKIVARTNALNKLVGATERYSTCWSTPALWFYVSGDGSVYSCGAHVKNENFHLGNIFTQDIADIWRSDKRKKCLDHVQDELDLASCRRTCRMDEVNTYLSDLIEQNVDHVNFILIKNDCFSLSSSELDDLVAHSSKLRLSLLNISSKYKIPHLGSCLSCVEILTYCYWHRLNLDINNPSSPNRDRFVLSKGHASPLLLQVLAHRGYFPVSDLEKFGQNGSYFHEHPPKPGLLNGVEAATGSLGHGFSMALGMSLASKINNQNYQTYAVLGDGECNEGVIWEAAMLAPSLNLSSLTVIVDYNKWQATGRSNDVLSLSPLANKWSSFGWHTQEIDGHDLRELDYAFLQTSIETERPSVIIANTVKGKGVTFMEDDNNWHYKTPNSEELELALHEVKRGSLNEKSICKSYGANGFRNS